MEGSESEAVFDAHNLNPQRFINEVLNAVDELVEGAFDFGLQQASVITGGGDAATDRSDELAQGISSIRHLTQAVLDKRMSMWEKYCLRHCFAVPEGFVVPKAKDCSSDGLLLQEVLSDEELDSELSSLRNKLAVVGLESGELQRELHSLEEHSILSSSYDAHVAEVLNLYEQNYLHKTFQDIGEAASKLRLKMEEVKVKRREDVEQGRIGAMHIPSKKQHVAYDMDLTARLEDIQVVADILKNM